MCLVLGLDCSGAPRELAVGESISVQVRARRSQTFTGVIVEPSQKFAIEADAGDRWVDFYIVTTAQGYARPYLERYGPKKRLPAAPWFALLGQVRGSGPFLVGRSWSGRGPGSGELQLFPNDLPRMYWNNFGLILVRITRIE